MVNTLLLFVCGGILYVLYVIIKYISYVYTINRKLHWVSGPSFLAGNMEVFGADQSGIRKFLNKMHKIYGPIFKVWLGPFLYIFVTDPNMNQILANTGKRARKSKPYEYVKNFCGFSILTSHGDIWYTKRKMLTPCFHYEILDEFMIGMNAHSKKLVDHLSPLADKSQTFDFYGIAKLSSLDILMETVMGLNINALDNENSHYNKAINRMRELVMSRTISLFLQLDFAYYFSSVKKLEDQVINTIKTFVREVIKKRKECRKMLDQEKLPRDEKRKKALLDMFLDMNENGISFPNEDIENEVNTFIFAGHDTTSVAISYTIYILGRHPEIQERVYNELMEKIPNIMEVSVTQSDLNKLEYLDRCIKESLRMFPPVPLIGKMFDEPLETDKGNIPPNINVSQNIYALHNDENLYPQPNIFDPDRFLPDRQIKKHHTYIPFGSGSRNCIGQKFALNEMKLVVAHLVKNYSIKSAQEPEEIKMGFDLVLTPLNGIHISIHRR